MNLTRLFRTLPVALAFSILLPVSISFAAGIEVTDSYARAVPAGHPNSAAFMTITNNSNQDRSIVQANSNISKVVELHTHKKEGGMMRMRKVEKIDIPANSKTVLKPGGLHVMFIGLKQPIKAGDDISLELLFDDKSRLKLTVTVKNIAGMLHKKMQKINRAH